MKKNKSLHLTIALTALTFGLIHPQAQAALKTWSGVGGDANWNTGANWGGTAPVNNDTLIFSGITQQNNTNDIIGGVIVGTVTFGNGDFTLNGNQLILTNTTAGIFTNTAGTNIIAMDVFIQPAAVTPKVWSIAAGSELRFSGAVTNAQAANPLGSVVGGGTLRITSASFQPNRFFTLVNGTIVFDGAFGTSQDGFRLQPPSGSTAAFQLTNNSTLRLLNGANLRLGQTATAGTTRVDVSSGLLEVAATSGGGAGNIYVGEAASTTVVFNQTGGTVATDGSNADNRVAFANGNASANGTYNLSGGMLLTKQIVQITAGAPGGTFNFNGGTLKPLTSSTTFFQGVQTANVQSGGAVIDTTNFNITIGQNLLAAGGGLTKLGTGTLTLSGANTYTGGTVISNGTLAITTTNLTGGGDLSIADGATLSVTVAGIGTAVGSSSLTVGASSGSTINFNVTGTPTTAPLAVTSLTANAPVTVNVSGTGFAAGVFELIHFATATGLANFQLGTVPLGVSATLVTNASSVSLNIASAVNSLAWSGAENDSWDTSSVDWKDAGNANNPTNYAQAGGFGDIVLFDDTALSNTTINVTLAVTPVSMTFSNSSLAYAFSGPGEIDGLGSLTKYLTNSLTIGTSNNYSGGTIVNAGRIRVGNDNALGSGLLTLNGGSVSSDSATAHSVPNATKITTGTTVFGDATDNGLMTYSTLVDLGAGARTLTINSDTVFANGLTNGAMNVKNGTATLTVKGAVDFSGFQDVRNGTLIFDGATVNSSDRLVTDSTLLTASARLVITNGATVTVNTAVGNLRAGRSAGGTNYIDLAGLYSVPNADSVDGFLTLRADALYSEITFWPGGDFTARGVTLFGSGSGTTVIKFNGGILRARNDNANFFEGLSQTLVQAGGANIDDGGFTIAINQNFLDGGGAGGLTKTGSGRLLLNGNNTYTGATLVSQGILGGSGTLSGPVILASGATLAPGATSAIGTLTINNSLTLSTGGAVSVQVNKDDSSKDLVTGLTDVTYAGTLTVTNIGVNPLSGGETFQLFSASGPKSGNFSSIVIQPPSGVTNGVFDPTTGILTITSPIPTTPTNITFSVSGGNLNLSWPDSYLGWSLQVQTNSLSTGIDTNWVTIPGSESVTATNFPVDPTSDAVFYRMFYQP